MKATANAPVAVASSSTTNDSNNIINNKPINPSNSTTDAETRQHPRNLRSNSVPDSKPGFLPNRAVNSAPPLTNMSNLANTSDSTNSPRPDSKNSSVASKEVSAGSNRANKAHNSGADGNNSRMFSPRHRRHNGDQTTQSPRNTKKTNNVQDPASLGRILVTGYPTYTQPHELLEIFDKFGAVRLDHCNSWSATLTYSRAEHAQLALNASNRAHVYGHFLSVRPYSAKLRADEGPHEPRRQFAKTKQKSVIIEPAKIDLSGDFHAQLDMIMAAIRLSQEDINRISILYRDLENAFQVQWPGCKAIPFGSITTGLGIKTSDADCFISLAPQHRSAHGNHVNKARRLLAQYPHIFTEILAIPRANTPIVKFYHVPTDTNCDLTFKTPLGAQNSRLIAFLLNADPRITPVAVIIKYWAKVHDLSGTGKLTNYALTMMIIFYMQQLSILPSVEWLQRDRNNDLHVDYWNTGFMNNPNYLTPSTNTSSISELLGGFFEFYSTFNFDQLTVCPFLGTPIKKDAFKDTLTLPPEFDLYKSNVTNSYVMPIRFQTSFCVQDPFEQCHNVASTITSKLALDIVTYFKFAATAYEKEKLNGCTGFLKTILLEKPKLVRPKNHPDYRINLFPRVINTIIRDLDWKSLIRNLVMILFQNMLKLELVKETIQENGKPDARKEKEKYTGNVTKPIWKRKKYSSMYVAPELGVEERQTLITEEIIKKEMQPISLQFQLTLSFCNDPKSAMISIRMSNGDLDAYREFGKFFISVVQNWLMALLRPHSVPTPRDTPAKTAETVKKDDKLNDKNGNEANDKTATTPSTKLAQQTEVKEEETSPNSGEVTHDTCVN